MTLPKPHILLNLFHGKELSGQVPPVLKLFPERPSYKPELKLSYLLVKPFPVRREVTKEKG